MLNSKSSRIILYILVLILSAPVSVYAYNDYSYNKNIEEGVFLKDNDEFEKAIESYRKAQKYKSNVEEINREIEEIQNLKESKINFGEATKMLNENKYLEAIKYFKLVSDIDTKRFNISQDNIVLCSKNYITSKLDEARNKLSEGNIDEALSLSYSVIEFDNNNSDAKNFINELNNLKIQEDKQTQTKRIEDEKKLQEQQIIEGEAASKTIETPASSAPNTNTIKDNSAGTTINNEYPKITVSPNGINIYRNRAQEESRTVNNGMSIMSVVTLGRNAYNTINEINFSIYYIGEAIYTSLPYKATIHYQNTQYVKTGILKSGGVSNYITDNHISIDRNKPLGQVYIDFEVTINGKAYKFTKYPSSTKGL